MFEAGKLNVLEGVGNEAQRVEWTKKIRCELQRGEEKMKSEWSKLRKKA